MKISKLQNTEKNFMFILEAYIKNEIILEFKNS
jgi:hypothetical protein